MAEFKFRMATLLRLREATRDERHRELADAYRVENALRQQAYQLREEIVSLTARCRQAAGPGTVDVGRLAEVDRYERVLRERETQIQQQRQTAQIEIEYRRQRLLEANRDVRALEKLRDREAERQQRVELRLETGRIDEAVAHHTNREAAA